MWQLENSQNQSNGRVEEISTIVSNISGQIEKVRERYLS